MQNCQKVLHVHSLSDVRPWCGISISDKGGEKFTQQNSIIAQAFNNDDTMNEVLFLCVRNSFTFFNIFVRSNNVARRNKFRLSWKPYKGNF